MIWNGREVRTIGDTLDALCSLQTRDEAREFWKLYVAHLGRPDAELNGLTPEQVASSNIGYLMGYCGEEERNRVYDLFAEFNVSHPIFGRRTPKPDEALATGAAIARGDRPQG